MSVVEPLDLDFYCWRERVTSAGVERLLVPCSDPMRYEFPIDFVFDSPQAALDAVESFEDVFDADSWVLVHYTGTIIDVPSDS